jgi:hypothetical protein
MIGSTTNANFYVPDKNKKTQPETFQATAILRDRRWQRSKNIIFSGFFLKWINYPSDTQKAGFSVSV